MANRIRSEKVKTARRNRECINCGQMIKKGQQYGNRLIRYDGKLITENYCLAETCYPAGFKRSEGLV